MSASILFAIYVLLVLNFIGPEQAVGEIELRGMAIAAPLLPYPLVFLFRLVTSIADRDIAANAEVDRMAWRLTPQLEINVLNDGAPLEFRDGKKPRHYVCFSVRNPAACRTDIVSANLLTLTGDNDSVLRDSIEFQWQPDGPHMDKWVSIPAGEVRTAMLFEAVEGGGIAFGVPVNALDYQTFFEGGTRFEGTMSIGDRYYGTQVVHFTLTADPLRIEVHRIDPPDPATIKDVRNEQPPLN